MISNCGHDENNAYHGGTAGDQTGTEWQLRSWYNRPWNYVLRHPTAKVRTAICKLAKDAANNNNIGYDQYERTTFWYKLKAANYDASKITEKCETDCSAGVAAIVKAVGYLLNIAKLQSVSIDIYTGNEKNALKNAGFEVLTDSKYLTSDKYLLEGDILLNESHHTCINVTNGSKATTTTTESTTKTVNKTVKWNGTVNASELNVRENPGTSSTILRKLKNGTTVGVCDTAEDSDGDVWYYIKESGKYGYVSADYITKKITTTTSTSTTLSKTCQWKGKVTTKSSPLAVRSWAGAENKKLRSLAKGTIVEVCDSLTASDGSTWYYIKESGKYGFVHSQYITRV